MATQPGNLSPPIHQATVWEEAYSRFETPEQEIKKFTKRLKAVEFLSLSKDLAVVELFCGRGNGLIALSRMGFSRIDGVDNSPFLLSQYIGPAKCHVADCRSLPFEKHSKNVVVIQGGLHHLHSIPDDLDRCLREIKRVLSPQGQVFIVEPWLTPFLSIVHAICKSIWIRRLIPKMDALATMIEHEYVTYFQWLNQPKQIMAALDAYFVCQQVQRRWGKLIFIGSMRKKNAP